MTHLVDEPRSFADDAIRGFADAYPHLVRGVDGGVVRAVPGAPGKPAVVVGGGSGHYPAFAGFVGPGFADGAVAGHVFTSPSVGRVHSVATAAQRGGGVVLACGNYAGDLLNFSLAADRLKSEGIDTRLVLVTDDIASAPDDERSARRGIAGGFVVFKLAAAAAEAGADLDAVERIALAANDATRTLGVAFDGCTLPGEPAPLFEVAAGRMATGLGIHGEAGISEDELPRAEQLAELLVRSVLGGADTAGRRAAVLLNGLGATKSEELFVLWASVARRLRAAGVRLVAPEVRELVTSLDMAGCSLTVTWLDDELEPLWLAPCQTPGYVRLEHAHALALAEVAPVPASTHVEALGPKRTGRVITALHIAARTLAAAEGELGRLDAVAGDGDHGTAMVRGSAAAAEAAQRCAGDDRAALAAAATAWGEAAGGTSGVLWSCALSAFADALFADGPPGASRLASAVRTAVDAVAELGKAQPGDKTMLDAMLPYADELARRVAAGDDITTALRTAAAVAAQAAQATSTMRARVGRARPLGDRTIGHADPGATSFAMVVGALIDVVASE